MDVEPLGTSDDREPHPTGDLASSGMSGVVDVDEHLTASVVALTRLSTARLFLEDLLTRVASIAVRTIPGAEGAGLTLIDEGRAGTVVNTDAFVRDLDDIQYGIGDGPCVSAAATRQTMRSGSLSDDPWWPSFGPRAGLRGVHSVLSFPLLVNERVVGAMNVYAHPEDAFDDRAEHIGQLFAEPAAIAVQNAQILAQTQRRVANLQSALTTRAVVDKAIGVLISRSGATPEAAFNRIRALSQNNDLKVSAVAANIVDEAVRRARARSVQRPDPTAGPAQPWPSVTNPVAAQAGNHGRPK